MRLYLTVVLLIVMVSNTLVNWSHDFFDCIEKIEISKLTDGEGENETKDKKEEAEKKEQIDAYTHASNYHIGILQKDAWFEAKLSSYRYQKIVTPPPEFI